MPTHKSPAKRMKTAEKARKRNRRIKSLIRTAVANVKTEKDSVKKGENLKTAVAILDKAAGKRVIPKNKAARVKSMLAKSIGKK